jgi:hypothetical protein
VKRVLLSISALGLVLMVSSCGGGGNGQLSKSEYESKIGAILQPLQGSTLQKLVTISPGDRDRAVLALKDGESTLRDAVSELESMKPPDDAVDPTRLLAKGVRAIAGQVTAIRKDAERGDFAGLLQFKISLGTDPAVSDIRDGATQLIGLGYNIAGTGP